MENRDAEVLLLRCRGACMELWRIEEMCCRGADMENGGAEVVQDRYRLLGDAEVLNRCR